MESFHCESMHFGFELALELVVPIVIFITSLSQEPTASDYLESLVEKSPVFHDQQPNLQELDTTTSLVSE